MPCIYQAAAAQGEAVLLEEQLEPELIALRRGEPAIQEVIEPDEEPTRVGTQGGADHGTGEPADDRAKDKRPDARNRRPLQAGSLRVGRRIRCLVDVS